eukprot:CAMPEP_0197603966 /NCGR_PEP_ID=MMETSP1326-20131121/40262_1 /TAXON_ID=1155430 /ORGANISM="Genus nov. species nov., Strain RCC2288" /LENGTH=160 /DNA_ID=CAMNT_0043171557 /DNA_START=186 /DNA_END=665 /DNA_ORIENTATION=+
MTRAPVEPVHRHPHARLQREDHGEVTPCWQVGDGTGHVAGYVGAERQQPGVGVLAPVFQVSKQPLHRLHLLQPQLAPLMPRDVLRVDETERRLAAHVFWKVRLDILQLLGAGAGPGLCGRGVESNDGVVRVNDSPIIVHHHQPRVAHNRTRLIDPPAQGV